MNSKLFNWCTAKSEKKRVFSFNEGSKSDINLLGVKGANVCDLSRYTVFVINKYST
jgi:hypothetical protein